MQGRWQVSRRSGRESSCVAVLVVRTQPAARMWAGTSLSSAGSALTGFAVVLQVYDRTRSPVAVGAIGVAQMVLALMMGLLGGPVTDEMDGRKLVTIRNLRVIGRERT
jgi:hypothetical protein